jgi:hypothetical protein
MPANSTLRVTIRDATKDLLRKARGAVPDSMPNAEWAGKDHGDINERLRNEVPRPRLGGERQGRGGERFKTLDLGNVSGLSEDQRISWDVAA